MYDHLPGGARLRREGVAVPEHAFADPEHRLYELLAPEDPDSAHGRYNAQPVHQTAGEGVLLPWEPSRRLTPPLPPPILNGGSFIT
jgi:hypothetical protein